MMVDDSEKIKKELCRAVVTFALMHKQNHHLTTNWKEPIIGFADASHPYIRNLRTLISPTHYMPEEFLPDCTVILSCFLPFANEIGNSNVEGDVPSTIWTNAYNETNQMFTEMSKHLSHIISQWGYSAVIPASIGVIDAEHIYSNWSQRHIAYAAGIGTFGINNMLITNAGTCGRFFSLITNLPVISDMPLKEERCLYKRNGTCGLCVKQCPIHAISPAKPFDRRSCSERLNGFKQHLGAGACGKCVVGLPCTFCNPSITEKAKETN